MTSHCRGHQGAALYITNARPIYPDSVWIYEPSMDRRDPPVWSLAENKVPGQRIILFESTPIDVSQRSVVRPDYAVWRLYAKNVGTSNDGFIGAFGKLNTESFYIENTYISGIRYALLRRTGTSSRLRSMARTHKILTRVEFSHGTRPTYDHYLQVVSAEGFRVMNKARSDQRWEYTVHCGCEHGKCQQGAFPLRYCCFSCVDSHRWLSQVRRDLLEAKQDLEALRR